MSSDLIKLVGDRRLWTGPALWVFLLLIAGNVWVGNHVDWLESYKRGNLLMTEPALSATSPNVQYDVSCGENIKDYWPHVPDATTTRLVVISGMSQMHAINNRKPGDKIISQWMDDTLRPDRVRVWGEAAPNLCNEEALFQMLAFCSQKRTTPAVFIYALCFDKFRDVDLRPGYREFLRSRPDLMTAYAQAADQFSATYPMACAKMRSTLADMTQNAAGTGDATFESRLRDRIGRVVPLVAQRENLNMQMQFTVYHARNALLHITPTTKRPIIQSRYDLNKQFLEMMADVAKAHHVQLIVYVIPLNQQAENPYVPAEYAAFKVWAKQFADERGLPFTNLEGIIPLDEWGEYNGGPDFKHFRGEGHRRTAAAVIAAFRPWIVGDRPNETAGTHS